MGCRLTCLDNVLKINNVLVQCHINSQPATDDNQNNDFDANSLIIEDEGPHSLYNSATLLSKLHLSEEEMYDQFCERIRNTEASDPNSGF